MTNSDTVYEYKKVGIIKEEDWNEYQALAESSEGLKRDRIVKNKINELVIEQNHLMKDFELYKKAFKQLQADYNRRIIGND